MFFFKFLELQWEISFRKNYRSKWINLFIYLSNSKKIQQQISRNDHSDAGNDIARFHDFLVFGSGLPLSNGTRLLKHISSQINIQLGDTLALEYNISGIDREDNHRRVQTSTGNKSFITLAVAQLRCNNVPFVGEIRSYKRQILDLLFIEFSVL